MYFLRNRLQMIKKISKIFLFLCQNAEAKIYFGHAKIYFSRIKIYFIVIFVLKQTNIVL